MTNDLAPTLEERVARLEFEVHALNGSVALLTGEKKTALRSEPSHSLLPAAVRGTLAALDLQPATPALVAQHTPPIASRTPAYCPGCKGGSPSAASQCQWCGIPLSVATASVQTMPQAPEQQVQHKPDSRVRVISYNAAMPEPQQQETTQHPTVPNPPSPRRQFVPEPPEPRKPFNLAVWLSRVGIVLFLLGVAFLFKYSYDQGWLDRFFTYQMRVITGITFGSVLLFLGLRLGRGHRNLSQVLMGGSIATYYITAYAASALFSLASTDTSCIFMMSVTALAFILAANQNHMSLGIIGVAGGLLTPFVLYSLHVDTSWLVAYTCYILAGSSAIYLFKGWRTLFWVSFAGAWGALCIAHVTLLVLQDQLEAPAQAQAALETGIVACLLAFWAVPVLREVLFATDPKRWPHQPLPVYLLQSGETNAGQVAADVDLTTDCLLTLTMPLACLYLSSGLSGYLTKDGIAIAALVGAGLFAALGWALQRFNVKLAYTHTVSAVLLLTVFLSLELTGDTLLLALAVEGVALHLIAHRYGDRFARLGGHASFLAAGLWLTLRLATGYLQNPGTFPVFNAEALTDLAVFALALLASYWQRLPEEKLIYRGAAYIAVLPWLAHELHWWDTYYLLAAWALYAATMHFLARSREDAVASAVGHIGFALAGAALALTMFTDLVFHTHQVAFFRPAALSGLAVIVLAALSSFIVQPGRTVDIYRVGVHAAVVGWFAVQVQSLAWPTHYALFFCMAYGAALLLLNRWAPDRLTLLCGQVIATSAGALFLMQTTIGLLMTNSYETPILNWRGLSDLGVVALGVVVWRLLKSDEYALAYGLGLYIGFGGWLWQELGMIPPSTTGNAVASIGWGVYAVALLACGIRRDRDRTLIYMGVGTLFATAVKLLLVDLRYVDAFWRILLFLGFGVLFLSIAYYLEKIMLSPQRPARPSTSGSAAQPSEPPGSSQSSGADAATRARLAP